MNDPGDPDRALEHGHRRRDDERLRLHRLIAQRLLRNPAETVAIARANLRRWRESMGPQPYYEEWENLLDTHTPQELASLISADDEQGRRLRQSTPFVGVVPRTEGDEIIRRGRPPEDAK